MKMKDKDGLDQVDFVLEATMDELYKIRNMAGNLAELETVFQNAKSQYDKYARLYTCYYRMLTRSEDY